MQSSVSRYLLSALAAIVAFSAQPALARHHAGAFHHAIYRHVRLHAPSDDSWHARRAVVQSAWQSGGLYGSAEQSFAAPVTGNAYGFGAPMRGQGFGAYSFGARSSAASGYDGLIAAQASANGVPASLVERVIRRESGGNARAVSAGNFGLMQIRLGTARAMGYTGSAAGLLDPATNMTYAVRYLAGAYRAAGGNESRAVALYARGYRAAPVQTASASAAFGWGSSYGRQPWSAPRWQEASWRATPSRASRWRLSGWQEQTSSWDAWGNAAMPYRTAVYVHHPLRYRRHSV